MLHSFRTRGRVPLSRVLVGVVAWAVAAVGVVVLATPASATLTGGTVCPDGAFPCTAASTGPAGATDQTYVFRFYTDHAISGAWGGGSLTLYSGNGAAFPTGSGLYDVYSEGNADCFPGHFGYGVTVTGGSSVTLDTTFQCIGAGTWVDVTVHGVTNPTTPGTDYYAEVSTSADPTPVATSTYTISAGTPPSAPVITAATPEPGTVSLAWQPPSDAGSSAITDYLVNAYAQGTTTPVVLDTGSTSTSYQPFGLTNGTSYTFTVQAVNAAGPGAESASSDPVTLMSVPFAPSNVVASRVSSTKDRVRWSIDNNGGSPLTQQIILVYVYRSATANAPASYTLLRQVTLGGSPRSATITGLSQYKHYVFRVIAFNAIGQSAASFPSNVVRG